MRNNYSFGGLDDGQTALQEACTGLSKYEPGLVEAASYNYQEVQYFLQYETFISQFPDAAIEYPDEHQESKRIKVNYFAPQTDGIVEYHS